MDQNDPLRETNIDRQQVLELDSRFWKAELERRWEEIESGKVVCRPAESVFMELRKKYP